MFGEGEDLGDGFVAKAQLRVRVRPPQHPVAQDVVDRLVAAYEERLDLICDEVDEVLRGADSRRSVPLVLALGAAGARSRDPIQKAVQQPYAPGSKGGKWYRDGQGHVRYGEAPQGQFKTRAPSGHADLVPHVSHYRPAPFMGAHGMDGEVTDFLIDRGSKHGFSGGELRFLGSWFGTHDKNGPLLDAFLKCTGLTRDDLKRDVGRLKFGPQGISYEEAVFEFFAAQGALFMGKEPTTADEKTEWERVLNDEIKPALDNLFLKFEGVKGDESFQDKFVNEPDRRFGVLVRRARASGDATKDVANCITSEPDPSKQVMGVIAGMKKLGLFLSQARADANAVAHDAPHLRGGLVLDDGLLADDPKRSPIVANADKLDALTASQLMLVYVGAELCRRWDHETMSYSDEPQSAKAAGSVGQVVLEALDRKPGRGGKTSQLVRKHLDGTVDRIVSAFNVEDEE